MTSCYRRRAMHDDSLRVSNSAFEWPAEPLAEGGMAVVYEATDRRLPRQVILKSPRTRRSGGGELSPDERAAFIERLEAEARVLARIQHPSVVTIHEVGRADDGLPFCVLERVDGRPLTAVLEELAEREAEDDRPHTAQRLQLVSSLVAIAEALACAHDRGIVHRDVNPNNVLVGPRGEMTLIDWGIASDTRSTRNITMALDRAADGIDADARFVTIGAGTPPYMSLEQTQGVAARPSFDVYSFGATLYHVVAGHPPFAYDSVQEFLAILDRRTLPPPASKDDRDLSAIIALAMAPDETSRPTMSELVDHLRAYLTGELVFEARYSRTGRLARWVRRQPAFAAAIAAAVVAAVALVVVWTVSEERAARAARDAAEVKMAAEARASDALRLAAQKAEAQAVAERQRADAVVERQRAEDVATAKEAEARAALEEAEAARGDRERYKQLKTRADAAAAAADDARRTADAGLVRAEAAARAAAAQAQEASADARRSQEAATAEAARAQAATARADAFAAQRDQALGQREAAVAERDAAVRARVAAEEARQAAERGRAEAETQRAAAEQSLATAQARIAELERALAEATAEPAPAPTP
jgi:tRNA A-37 threonylcarbamoyl transferase component Bud32